MIELLKDQDLWALKRRLEHEIEYFTIEHNIPHIAAEKIERLEEVEAELTRRDI